jgi:hypothetical protein
MAEKYPNKVKGMTDKEVDDNAERGKAMKGVNDVMDHADRHMPTTGSERGTPLGWDTKDTGNYGSDMD